MGNLQFFDPKCPETVRDLCCEFVASGTGGAGCSCRCERDSERILDLQADRQELENIQFQVDNDYLDKEEAREIIRRKLKGFIL